MSCIIRRRRDYLGGIKGALSSGDFNSDFSADFQIQDSGLDGHPFVDLGLPSGKMWAEFNVGTDGVYGIGDRFRFADINKIQTSPPNDYQDYIWSLAPYCSPTQALGEYGAAAVVSKYTVDDATLELSDDSVRANMGGRWRTPTIAEFGELLNNCTKTAITDTTKYGCAGIEFTSEINGAVIFFPIIPMMKIRLYDTAHTDLTYTYENCFAYCTSQVRMSSAGEGLYTGAWSNYVLYAANFSTSISLNSFHRRMPLMYRGILDPTENLS